MLAGRFLGDREGPATGWSFVNGTSWSDEGKGVLFVDGPASADM